MQRPEEAGDPGSVRPGERRMAEIFGEVLPDVTADERDEERRDGRADTWHLANRPPHHDREY